MGSSTRAPTAAHLLRHPVIDRFVSACRTDPRVLAAFVSGSHATGTADAHSDVDLALITTEDAYQEFLTTRADFIRLLGEPLFLEDFDRPETLFFILADGTEGELAVGHAGNYQHIARGPYHLLLDRPGLLAGVTMRGTQPDPGKQREVVRRLIVWFWHDLSHFLTAIARGQLVWAHGQLEALRCVCLSLARLQHDPADTAIGLEAYFKVEQVLSAEQLSLFTASLCPVEAPAMLIAARAIGRLYRELAPGLAAAHSVAYPLALERLMLARLEESTAFDRSGSSAASA